MELVYTRDYASLAWVKYSNPGADFPCGVETGSTGSNPVLNVRLNKNNFQGYSQRDMDNCRT